MSASRHCARFQGNEKQAVSSANMLSASAPSSLRKAATCDSSISAGLPAHDLGEALDANGRPLCIMPKSELLRQRLRCRSVAILATSPGNMLLLASKPGPIFDVSCHDLVSASMAADEFAAWLLESSLGSAARLNCVSVLRNGPVSISIFSAIFSNSFLAAREGEDFLLSHMAELDELAARHLATPLLLAARAAFNP